MKRTPETDSVAGNLTGVNLCAAFETKCRQLEIERDMARATANSFRQSAEIIFGVMPFPRRFHWEVNETKETDQ
jgi:hypothetical protein